MKFSDTKYGDLTGQDVTISSHVNIAERGIDDLTGSPEILRGNFFCNKNNITSLKNAPKEIYGNTYFGYNKLTSLEGNLETVNGVFQISFNPLKTFKGNLRKVTGILMARGLSEFRSKEEIDNALIEADITVGGDIVTDFGTFRQDPKKMEAFKARYKIGILNKFL